MMLPEYNELDITSEETGQKGHWLKLFRCSICTRFIFYYPISLKEPIDVPEPRHQWTLCKACYEALLVEIRRSVINSSIRLRIAMGLVAAERSPHAYLDTKTSELKQFEREFAWFVWAVVLFGLLHVAIFAILLALPR